MSAEKLAAAIADVEKDSELSDEQKGRKVALLKLQNELDDQNAAMTGVGLRWFASMTRGKGSQVIKYQGFDESHPDTLPKSVKEFVNTVGLKLDADGSQLVPLLITGYNDQQYTEASDPIAEYVNPAWSDELKTGFRTAVKAIAKAQEISVADVVAFVKPGFEKKFASLSK